MKRIIFISIYIFISYAAQGHGGTEKITTVKKQTVMEYVSMGNDFAEITMELYDNGKFTILIYPKENGKSLKLKGRWEKNNNFYVLKFKRTPMAVEMLFNMNDPNRFQVLNEMDIKFNEHLSSLWIWGIQCKRAKKTENV